jgi:hypothetical protein
VDGHGTTFSSGAAIVPPSVRRNIRNAPAIGCIELRTGIYTPGGAGDFPLKQAFLAFLQADTVAEHIAASADTHTFESPFDPVSMYIMEVFDKATFAQVPLELTGDPARPVTVRPDADRDYKVGTGKSWRMGKKMLGAGFVSKRAVAHARFTCGVGLPVRPAGGGELGRRLRAEVELVDLGQHSIAGRRFGSVGGRSGEFAGRGAPLGGH